MQKKILSFSLFFLSLLAAFFSWFSVSSAITVAGSSVWLVPTLWLSLFYLAYCLEFVLVKEKILINLSIGLGILLSLIFAPNIWHFLILLFSALLMSISYLQIKKDLGMNVELHLPKTLRMGKISFMLALALVISSQYYFEGKEAGLLKIPTFNASAILENKWTKELLYRLNPDLQKLDNKKIQSFVVPDYESEKLPAVPIAMAVVLFLTVLSLGAFLVRILVHLASFVFWILLSMKIVKIKKVPVEMEVIE